MSPPPPKPTKKAPGSKKSSNMEHIQGAKGKVTPDNTLSKKRVKVENKGEIGQEGAVSKASAPENLPQIAPKIPTLQERIANWGVIAASEQGGARINALKQQESLIAQYEAQAAQDGAGVSAELAAFIGELRLRYCSNQSGVRLKQAVNTG